MESQLKYFDISLLTENLLSLIGLLFSFLYNKINMKLHSIKGIKNIYSDMNFTNTEESNITKIKFVFHVYPIIRYFDGVNKYRVVVFIFEQEKFRKLHPIKLCQGCILLHHFLFICRAYNYLS